MLKSVSNDSAVDGRMLHLVSKVRDFLANVLSGCLYAI